MDNRAQGEQVESVDSYWSEWAREADLPTYGRDMDEEASDDTNAPLSSPGLGSDIGVIQNSVAHSFPVLKIRPPATGTTSECFSGNATCGIAAANKESMIGTLCGKKEPNAVQNCGTKLLFDATQVSFHLKRGDNLLGESWSQRDEDMSKKKGVPDDGLDQQWRTKFGHGVSDVNIDPCNLLSERNHVFISPLYVEQHASANTSNKRLDDAMSVDSCHSRSSYPHQTYSSDVIHEPSERDVKSDLSTDSCGFGPHWPMQCSYEVGKSAPEKGQQLMDDVSKRRNTIINSSLDVLLEESFTSVRHGLSSPTSIHSLGRASTVLSKLCETESMPTEQAHLVVQAMHCLSELFLFHSSNGHWDLKEEDYDILKSMIDELSASLKHFQGTERQQLPSSLPCPAQLFGKSTPRGKSVRSEVPHIRSAQANDQGQSTLPHISRERKSYLVQGEPNKVDSVLVPSDDLENVGNDKMAQAIKKVLVDNFDDDVEPSLHVQLFKNLWLEAEATLCSMKFKSCFKRVKMEMERLKSFQSGDSSDNLWDMENLLSLHSSTNSRGEDKSALQARCHANQDITAQCFLALSAGSNINDVMARFGILKDRGFNLDAISAGDKVERVSPEDSKFGHNSNDVMARFNILKGRDFNSNTMSAGDDVEYFCPEDSQSQNLMETDESTTRACPLGGFIGSISDSSPVKIPTNRMDDANPSIMERLSILRQRSDSLVSMNIQPRPKEGACLGSSLKNNYFSGLAEKTDVLSFSNCPAFRHQTANPDDEILTSKDVRASLEDDEAPQSQSIGGSVNLNFARRSDSSPSSSDWELCGEGDLSAEI